jgi:hypothetical protein
MNAYIDSISIFGDRPIIQEHAYATDNNNDIWIVAVLAAAESPLSHCIQQPGEQIGKYKALTLKMLSCCIHESRAYPDSTSVKIFWNNVRQCHPNFRKNGEISFVSLKNHG